MRKPRILGCRKSNYYHVMSRVVDRRFIFGDEEMEFFRQIMRKLESFMGIRVLTYCIMSNHWHILLEVPSLTEMDDVELFERISQFYSKQKSKALIQEFERATKHAQQTGSDVWVNELRGRYLSRMGDLSMFVKELKERFSKWYNRRHNRRGTLWEERFKSVLVEDSEHVVSTMATYIDLNPVRAGLVEDSCDYRFCGYGEAVKGGKAARKGLEKVLQLQGPDVNWRETASFYQAKLSSSNKGDDADTTVRPKKMNCVLNESIRFSRDELLRCRVRYFSDGVALGDRSFIEEVFENNRPLFSERRKSGARKLRGGDWSGLCSLRDLNHAITAPKQEEK